MSHMMRATVVERTKVGNKPRNAVTPYSDSFNARTKLAVPDSFSAEDRRHSSDTTSTPDNKSMFTISADGEVWTLNVGGQLFQVKRSTLQRRGQGLLGELSPKHESYQEKTGQFFFDRNPKYLAAILEYYRTGQMHVRHDYCGSQLAEELRYWRLSDDVIGDCCWRRYSDLREEQSQNTRVLREFTDVCQIKLARLKGLPKWKERLWVTLDDPTYSKTAKIVLLVYLFLVTTSFANASAISYYASMEASLHNWPNQSTGWVANASAADERNLRAEAEHHHNTFRNSLNYVELVCLCVLFVFVGARSVVCPDKCEFWTNPLNIMDVMYLTLGVVNMFFGYNSSISTPELSAPVVMVSIHHFTMIVGLLRVFRAARHYRGVRELWYAIRASFREVWLLSMFVTIGVLIFGIVFYCAQLFSHDRIDNVFVGYWWALITMTTVGYGDVVPTVVIGYVIAAVCAMVGLVMISLPIPFIAHNFNLYYGYRSRCCRKLQDKSGEGAYK